MENQRIVTEGSNIDALKEENVSLREQIDILKGKLDSHALKSSALSKYIQFLEGLYLKALKQP